MVNRIGIILLDSNEIILRVYTVDKQPLWKLYRYQSYDLATGIPGKMATAAEIVEIIAQILLSRYASDITDWKICARNLHDTVVHDISAATGLAVEMLTLQREQELLCKGMLMETE